jgi:hypothetical protein
MPALQRGQEVAGVEGSVDMPEEAANRVEDLVLRTDNVTAIENAHLDQRHRSGRGRANNKTQPPKGAIETEQRVSLPTTSPSPRPSVTELVIAEVATFHDVFGFLGVPMIVVFVMSAIWTFTLAYIQVHATEMANSVMNTTNFDNGEFWLLPRPDDDIVISSAIMLSLFGIGYSGLVVMMLLFARLGNEVKTVDSSSGSLSGGVNPGVDGIADAVVKRNKTERCSKFDAYLEWVGRIVPKDIREHYYVSLLVH